MINLAMLGLGISYLQHADVAQASEIGKVNTYKNANSLKTNQLLELTKNGKTTKEVGVDVKTETHSQASKSNDTNKRADSNQASRLLKKNQNRIVDPKTIKDDWSLKNTKVKNRAPITPKKIHENQGTIKNINFINSEIKVKPNDKTDLQDNVYVNKDNFKDYFNQNGSAKGNYNPITGEQNLTTGSWQSGNITFKGGIDLRHNFRIDGAINLGKETKVRNVFRVIKGIADGIGIVFYKGTRNQIGRSGGNLGIYGVTNAFGWKADTWHNVGRSFKFGNTTRRLQGEADDAFPDPYGAMVTTNKNGQGTIDKDSVRPLPKIIEDNKYHAIKMIYTARTKEFKVILSTPTGDVIFKKKFDYDAKDPVYYFTIASSTGVLPTKQFFKIDSMKYTSIQKAFIKYIDDNTGTNMRVRVLTGQGGKTMKYSTRADIQDYLKQGYQLVSDNFVTGTTFDTDDRTDQIYEVHFKHGIESDFEKRNVKETVHYRYDNGQLARPIYQNVLNFERKVETDQVTKQRNYKNWQAVDGTSFKRVVSPYIKGYTAVPKLIDEITNINENHKNIEKIVVYKANDEKAQVKYFDDTTGRKLSEQFLHGAYGSRDVYRTANTIQRYKQMGYELVSDNYPKNGANYSQDKLVRVYEIHLKHKIVKQSEKSTLKEVIHYLYNNGHLAKPVYESVLKFSRMVGIDQVTGKKYYGIWQATEGTSFKKVVSPKIEGYTALPKVVVAINNINVNHANIEKTVVYKANDEKARVKYFDDTIGRKLSEQLLHGVYGSRDVYRTANTIQRYKQMGYELVSDNYPKNGANYSQDKLVRVYEIHLKHKIVKQPEKSTVKEVIHYLYDNGQPAGPIYENELDFKRIIEFDQVTKQKRYGNWQAIDGTYFKKVDSPKIIGYTPTLESIETINNIDGSHKDIEETVVYKINDEKAQVTYYDDTTRKKLSEKGLNGAYRTRDSYRTVDAINQYKWAGYELVSDDYPQNGVFYDQDKLIKMYEVHLKHGEKMDFEQRAVKEVIYYQYDDGQLAKPTYKNKLTFRRIVKIDQVTGQKYYGVWQAVDGTNFRSVVSPIVEGYTPIPEIVRAINNINSYHQDVEKTVVYQANKQNEVVGGNSPKKFEQIKIILVRVIHPNREVRINTEKSHTKKISLKLHHDRQKVESTHKTKFKLNTLIKSGDKIKKQNSVHQKRVIKKHQKLPQTGEKKSNKFVYFLLVPLLILSTIITILKRK
ncbi:LPXTG cell wall anchor domain-containing protein [Pediococcus pentosaceus]|uniref:mucin-binding protein n=1 Tax=Pediococcus pentosaceus TaxID=1255 RepID=UPI001330E89B|nr:LPXTG cell wall anchor domain-containing protein [Pediococcus pentosaceus]KAF0349279.1 LPXTG cell wall anchor domain-containing protein [Pediococcus pentosaceus]MBF7105465.1 LPXTG cell wall anchor domain-containing protein [Pediococcus pentosaceus]